MKIEESASRTDLKCASHRRTASPLATAPYLCRGDLWSPDGQCDEKPTANSPLHPKTALKKRLPWIRGGVGLIFFALGIFAVADHHTAVGLRAGGVGGDVGYILERCVDHMALVGVHGLQGDIPPVFDHLAGDLDG